jgi:hypothetical protein
MYARALVDAFRQVKYWELALLSLSIFLGTVALADAPYENCRCGPTTEPVISCECPLGTSHNDRCKGTLPKEGSHYYGNVTCVAQSGSSCSWFPGGGQNACGIVVMCPSLTCGTPITYYDESQCVDHPEKPPCTNTWGACAYTAP